MSDCANQPDEPTALVISLDEYRRAVKAARFLREDFYHPVRLKEVRAEVMPNGGARLLVVLWWETVMIRRFVPTRVCHVPVRIAVARPG